MDSKRPPGERVFSKNGPSSMWLKRFLRRNEINFPAGRAGGRNKVVKVRVSFFPEVDPIFLHLITEFYLLSENQRILDVSCVFLYFLLL